MSHKLLLSDITDQLAESANISKKEAGSFLKQLFDIIEEQLVADKIVKIKGLGTFKLIWVESRRIANVNTGEIQEVAGHYKTTFTPDAALAEAVNEPFSHLETIILDEELVTDTPVNTSSYPSESDKHDEIDIPLQENVEERISTESSVNDVADNEMTQPQKASRKWLTVLSVIVLALAAGFIGYVVGKSARNATAPQKAIVVTVIKKKIQPKDSIIKIFPVSKQENAKPSADSILTTEMLEAGARLTRVSQKYYGHKVFWVYLYQANKYVIGNPNKVTAGTVIDIPNPRIYGIDANNAESVAKAKTLEAEILSKLN